MRRLRAPSERAGAPRLALLALAWLCAENLARAVLSVLQARALPDLPTSLSPWVVAASGALWFAVFAAAFALVARRARHAAAFSLAAMAAYQANLWLNRLALSRSSEAIETAGFRAILSALSFAALAGALIVSQVWRPFGQRG